MSIGTVALTGGESQAVRRGDGGRAGRSLRSLRAVSRTCTVRRARAINSAACRRFTPLDREPNTGVEPVTSPVPRGRFPTDACPAWLGDQGSNPDLEDQNLSCCRCTIPELSGCTRDRTSPARTHRGYNPAPTPVGVHPRSWQRPGPATGTKPRRSETVRGGSACPRCPAASVEMRGIEPRAYAMPSRRSTSLSYIPLVPSRGADPRLDGYDPSVTAVPPGIAMVAGEGIAPSIFGL